MQIMQRVFYYLGIITWIAVIPIMSRDILQSFGIEQQGNARIYFLAAWYGIPAAFILWTDRKNIK